MNQIAGIGHNKGPMLEDGFTQKQREAWDILCNNNKKHILLYGGSRSGKTMIFCIAMTLRALRAPETTHTIFREHFNHLKQSVINQTMPMCHKLFFPGIRTKLNKADWELKFLDNDSKIIYGGLDDKDRTDKILGQEHSTIYLVEANQISFASRTKALTRLAQSSELTLKLFQDCNPPPKSHWLYKYFILKQNPVDGAPLRRPDIVATLQMNPEDNKENLPEEYHESLEDLSGRERERFLKGEFQSAVENPLWPEGIIKRCALVDPDCEVDMAQFARIAVAVDPSGCDKNEEVSNDMIGMGVVGLRHSGKAAVLADHTGYYTPATWGQLAVDLYHKWGADVILAEDNFGGEMVKSTIQTADDKVNVKKITVTRGKHLRAEPVSGLYEKELVEHAGHFTDMEQEMSEFSTAGYHGDKSPNRVDVLVMAVTELLLGKQKKARAWNI